MNYLSLNLMGMSMITLDYVFEASASTLLMALNTKLLELHMRFSNCMDTVFE